MILYVFHSKRYMVIMFFPLRVMHSNQYSMQPHHMGKKRPGYRDPHLRHVTHGRTFPSQLDLNLNCLHWVDQLQPFEVWPLERPLHHPLPLPRRLINRGSLQPSNHRRDHRKRPPIRLAGANFCTVRSNSHISLLAVTQGVPDKWPLLRQRVQVTAYWFTGSIHL